MNMTMNICRAFALAWGCTLSAIATDYNWALTGGALREGTVQADIAHNNTRLNEAFNWLRGQPDGDRIVFPAGKYYVSATVSPSGHNPNAGDRGAVNKILHFRSTEFVFMTAGTYDPIKLDDSTGAWKPLSDWSPTAAAPYPLHGTTNGVDTFVWNADLVDSPSGKLKTKEVAFNVRNCFGMRITGSLALTREVLDPNDSLVAIASNGGDYHASAGLGGASGMKNGTIQSLRLAQFAVGFFAEKFNSGSQKTADTFANVDIHQVHFQDCSRCFVVGQGHLDGAVIHQFVAVGKLTSYLFNAGTVRFGTGFLSQSKQGNLTPKVKLLEIVDGNITFGCIYGRPDNETFSVINVGNNADVTIGVLHNDSELKTTSGTLVTMAQNDRNTTNRSTSGNLRIHGAGQRAEVGIISGIVGLSACTSGIARQVYVGSFEDSDIAPVRAPVVVIDDFDDTAATVTTGDRIWSHTTQALRYRKIAFGALSDYNGQGW